MEYSKNIRSVPSQYIFDSINDIKKESAIEKEKNSNSERTYQEAYRQGFKKGHEEGFNKGVEEGTQKGENDFNNAHIQELQNYLNELQYRLELFEEEKQKWMNHFEHELSLLSLYITERILHKCFNDEKEWIKQCTLEITREALGQIAQEGKVRIYINPFDLVYLEEHQNILHEMAPKLRQIELVADRSIPGGCFIETENGIIDSRVDHMLRKIIEDILN